MYKRYTYSTVVSVMYYVTMFVVALVLILLLRNFLDAPNKKASCYECSVDITT